MDLTDNQEVVATTGDVDRAVVGLKPCLIG